MVNKKCRGIFQVTKRYDFGLNIMVGFINLYLNGGKDEKDVSNNNYNL